MEHISDNLLAYLENRLTPATRQQVEAHLANCESCLAEVAAMREMVSLLNETGRAAQSLPINTARRWSAIRERWQSPIVVGVRQVSRRLSWQVAASLMVVGMVFASGASLSNVQAANPSIPSIQTPGSVPALNSDTPTLSVTHAVTDSQTPTLTLTPMIQVAGDN